MPLIPKAVQPAVVSVNDAKADPNSSLSPITNTVARPGILTTEWWTLIVAGVTSAAIGIVGVSNNTATQIATTAAPVAVALIYAFVRGHTKGVSLTCYKRCSPKRAVLEWLPPEPRPARPVT